MLLWFTSVASLKVKKVPRSVPNLVVFYIQQRELSQLWRRLFSRSLSISQTKLQCPGNNEDNIMPGITAKVLSKTTLSPNGN